MENKLTYRKRPKWHDVLICQFILDDELRDQFDSWKKKHCSKVRSLNKIAYNFLLHCKGRFFINDIRHQVSYGVDFTPIKYFADISYVIQTPWIKGYERNKSKDDIEKEWEDTLKDL